MVEIPSELTAHEAQFIRSKLGPEDLSDERLPESLHPRVRVERLLGRFYLRQLLAKETKLDGLSWRFQIDAQGKPHVAHPELEVSPHINLSHTHGALLCGLSFDGELGVDIENSSREVDLEKLALRCFTSHERDWIEEAPTPRDGFFRAWTLKEAYLKAIGTGIRTPLQSIAIYPNHRKTLTIYQEGEPLDAWHFETQIRRHFHMSLCFDAAGEATSTTRWEFLTFVK